jgi:HTH-type transcriptional regulator/antitoxin HigA
MELLKDIGMMYTVIKTKEQYRAYCKIVMDIAMNRPESQEKEDEMELIEVLIDKWEAENIKLKPADLDPVQLLKSFLEDHKMKQKNLVELLGISKSAVSQILNYKKGLSKEVIRKLCDRFKMQQEAFNRPYKLKGQKVVAKKSVAKKSVVKKKTRTVRKAA